MKLLYVIWLLSVSTVDMQQVETWERYRLEQPIYYTEEQCLNLRDNRWGIAEQQDWFEWDAIMCLPKGIKPNWEHLRY